MIGIGATLGAPTPAFAWDEGWAATYNWQGRSVDEAFSILNAPDGGVVVTGSSCVWDLDPYGLVDRRARFTTVKYDGDGQLIWVAQYHNDNELNHWPHAQAVDAAGNVVVVGASANDVPDWDMATVKYDSSGALLWASHWIGPAGDDVAHAVAIDEAGNVYVSGMATATTAAAQTAAVLVKYDVAGNEQWAEQLPSGADVGVDAGSAIAVDAAGEVYVGSPGAILTKRDADGGLLWRVDRPDDQICAAKLNGDGDLVVAGIGNSNAAAFVASYTAAGDLDWEQTLSLGGERVGKVSTGCDASFDMALSPDDEILIAADGEFVARLDADGTVCWVTAVEMFIPRAVRFGADQTLWAAGLYQTGTPADPLDNYLAVIRFDLDGTVLNTIAHPSPYGSTAADLALDDQGRVWAAGSLCRFGLYPAIPRMPECLSWDFLTVRFDDTAPPADDDSADDDDDDVVDDDDDDSALADDDDGHDTAGDDDDDDEDSACGC